MPTLQKKLYDPPTRTTTFAYVYRQNGRIGWNGQCTQLWDLENHGLVA